MPNAKHCHQYWSRLDHTKVRVARLLQGFDRGEDVAARLKVKRTRYFSWENGTHRIPPKELTRLARLLKTTPEGLTTSPAKP